MLRRLLISLVLVAAALPARGADVDTLALARLHHMLEGYVQAIEALPTGDKAAECEFLISSCTDTLVRCEVVRWLFDHYSSSPLMGEEALAVGIHDTWIAPGSLPLEQSWSARAELYVRYCRSSLLGAQAPQLTLEGLDGREVMVPSTDVPADAAGRAACQRVLFFYDTSCQTCQMETILLRHLMEDFRDLDILFYAIYVGSDRAAWQEYATSQFRMGDNVTVVHAWDPQGVSDFALKYDVLGTPRMFLVDADGFIVGRRLNSEALKRLLGVAEIQRDLASRAPVGTLMPDISVPSTLLTQRKSLSQSAGVHSLRQRSRRTTVVFYTHGCGTCSETLSAAKASLRRRQRALLVDMDEVLSQDSALAATLFDTFDLTVMPKTFVLDRRGRIVAKDNLQSAK